MMLNNVLSTNLYPLITAKYYKKILIAGVIFFAVLYLPAKNLYIQWQQLHMLRQTYDKQTQSLAHLKRIFITLKKRPHLTISTSSKTRITEYFLHQKENTHIIQLHWISDSPYLNIHAILTYANLIDFITLANKNFPTLRLSQLRISKKNPEKHHIPGALLINMTWRLYSLPFNTNKDNV